jgi:hypothetical protein
MKTNIVPFPFVRIHFIKLYNNVTLYEDVKSGCKRKERFDRIQDAILYHSGYA